MKNNKDEKIRISIINGFLGSGKNHVTDTLY